MRGADWPLDAWPFDEARRPQPSRSSSTAIEPVPGVSFVVQHHTERAAILPALLARLPRDTTVMTSAVSGGMRESWPRYRLALYAIGAARHLVIIQDDALLALGFLDALAAILRRWPAHVVCLYAGATGTETQAAARRAHLHGAPYAWLPTPVYVPVVCTVWPRHLVECLVVEPPVTMSDDGYAGQWLHRHGQRVVQCAPSIAEHDNDLASTKPLKIVEAPRRAGWFEQEARPASWWRGRVV